MKILYSFVFALWLLLSDTNASTVGWGAQVSNSLGLANNSLANGTSVTVTDRALIKIGYFTITDTQIATAFSLGNLSTIQSAFVEFGTSRVGNGFNTNGVWDAQSVNNDIAFVGQRIHYWTFDTSTIGAATQWGIFTNTASAAWVFPSDSPLPGSTNTDISNVPTNATGIIVGSFGGGPDANFSNPIYRMSTLVTPVPEPSTFAACVVLAMAAMGVRRRRCG